MSKLKSVDFTRIELKWLHRQLLSGKDKASAIIKTYTGELSPQREKELHEAQMHYDELEKLSRAIGDRLDQGDRERLKLADLRAELEEALELSPTCSVAIREKLEALPKETPYRIQFDRATLKFTLQLVEKDLHKFRTHVIPNYEKSEESEYKDPIQTKTYWVNKAKKSKTILEQLKIKLEKGL